MIPRQSLAAVFLGALLATSAPGNDSKPPRLDRHGDPLPEHALARIGTVRLRHGGPITALSFSPDGKKLASASEDRTVSLWNVADGKELQRIIVGPKPVVALSHRRDGKTLIGWQKNGPIHRWDVTTGKELQSYPAWPKKPDVAAISADGTTVATAVTLIALGEGRSPLGEICLWDVQSGKLIRSINYDTGDISGLELSPDGKAVAAITEKVTVWNTGSGKKILDDGAREIRAVFGFANNGQLFFYLGHWPRYWDLKTGKRVEDPFKEKWQEHWQLSFIAVDRDKLLIGHDALTLIDLTKGEVCRELNGVPKAHKIAFSADQRQFATGDDKGTIRLWTMANLKEQSPLSLIGNGALIIRILNDRKTLLIQDGFFQLHSCEFPDGDKLRRHSRDSSLLLFDVSADGKFVATTEWQIEDSVWFENLRTGKKCSAAMQSIDGSKSYRHLESKFLQDGTLLSFVIQMRDESSNEKSPYFLVLNDVVTGKVRRYWGPIKGNFAGPMSMSPDLRFLALPLASGPNEPRTNVYLWPTEKGGPLLKTANLGIEATRAVFAPDSNYLAYWHGQYPWCNPFGPKSGNVHVWEVSTKGSALTIKQPASLTTIEVAFRRDGRLIALGQSNGDIVLWDLVTSNERRRLKGHRGPIHSLAFTDDGRKLVSGGSDSSAVIWDVKDLLTPQNPTGPALTAKQLESLWADLAGEDAQKGFRAVTTLADAPEQAIPFLQERLKPVAPLPAEQIQKLLADLNAQRFATRQRAREELVTQGRAIVPALKKALESEPPLEARRRMEELLTELKDHRPADPLRLSRALLSLEYIGDPAARKLLQTLADGASGAWLTEQAKAALERMVAE